MKIKTKLFLSIAISVILIIFVLISFYVSSNIITKERDRRGLATDIKTTIIELNLLMSDYLLYREDRAIEQWRSRYNSGQELIQNLAEDEDEEERRLMQSIITNYILMKELFEDEVDNYNIQRKLISEGASEEELELTITMQDRIVSQLLKVTQSIALSSVALEKITFTKLVSVETFVKQFIITLLIILLIVTSAVLIKVSKDITIPLSILTQSNIDISAGKFKKAKYQGQLNVPTEIGGLIKARDVMLTKLLNNERELINDKKQMEKLNEKLVSSERRLKTVFERTSDAIFVVNTDNWNIVDFNLHAQILTGYSAEKLDKISFSKLFPKEQRVMMMKFFSNCSIGIDSGLIQLDFININKEIISTEGSIVRLYLDGKMHVIGSFRDITERIKAEQARNMIFLNTSHELKTPITPISIQADMLQNEELGKLTPLQKESVDLIVRNMIRLDRLIGDILEVSRIQAGAIKLEIAKENLKKIIDGEIAKFKPVAEKKGITLKSHVVNISVYCDIGRIKQVLTNLLDNALKFTPKGRIIINAEKKKDFVVVNVKDTGIGITKFNIEKLFLPFFQVKSSYKLKKTGTGLGLSISRSIVQQHGGRMWVKSQGEGKGSTFYFTLPLKGKVLNISKK